MLSESELEKLANFVNKNIVVQKKLDREYDYENPCLVIIDAVLAKMRNYDMVEKRITKFEEKYPNTKTLKGLVELIEKEGYKKFGATIKYNDKSRMEEIEKVALEFLKIKEEKDFKDDFEAMKYWASTAEYDDEVKNNTGIASIKGIGIATFQYLKVLLGIETSKPDVHIMNFLERVIGIKYKEKDSIVAIEELSKYMNVKARLLDNAIWKYMRARDTKKEIGLSDIKDFINILDKEDLLEIQEYIEDRLVKY